MPKKPRIKLAYKRVKWDYKIYEHDPHLQDTHALEYAMNVHGAEGWELVSTTKARVIVDGINFIYKRERPPHKWEGEIYEKFKDALDEDGKPFFEDEYDD